VIAVEQDQHAALSKGSGAAVEESHTLCRERVRPGQVRKDLPAETVGEAEFDSHFSCVKPSRCPFRISTRVVERGVTFHENAYQFFSQIRALMTFQFRVYDDRTWADR
jgi:hypothetical protein